MPYYMKQGTITRVTDSKTVAFTEQLPPGFYQVRHHPQQGYYLEDTDGWERPSRVYGDVEKRIDRVIRTFEDRSSSTGILLSGEKGSGKTLFAKLLSLAAIEKKVPTILVTSGYCGDEFNRFMQEIADPAVVVFDEFEKVYDDAHQAELLTLFDGVYPTKKLFVVTCNETRINANMLNRPGRMYYHFEYRGVDETFIRDYCADTLKAKERVEEVCAVSVLFEDFNFDMLKAVVEEMNRYDEPAKNTLAYLNVRPDTLFGNYEVTIVGEGGEKPVNIHPKFYDGDPYSIDARFAADFKEKKGQDNKDIFNRTFDKVYEFSYEDIVKIDARNKALHYRNESGAKLILTKKTYRYSGKPMDYLDGME